MASGVSMAAEGAGDGVSAGADPVTTTFFAVLAA